MKFIVNNKLYDTDKAELLCTLKKQWECNTFFGKLYPYRDTNLYKTAKGNYFLTCKGGYGESIIEVIGEVDAKNYLMRNNYTKYVELFGALEEA